MIKSTRKDMHRRIVTAQMMPQDRSQHSTVAFRRAPAVVAAAPAAAAVVAEPVDAVPADLDRATVPCAGPWLVLVPWLLQL